MKFILLLYVVCSVGGVVASPTEKSDINCLAKNIYFESRSEPFLDKIATSFVVFNRVESSKFPDSVCGVIQQKLKRCAFSWYCDGIKDTLISTANGEIEAWEYAHILAESLYQNYKAVVDPTRGALYYNRHGFNWYNGKRTILYNSKNHEFWNPQ